MVTHLIKLVVSQLITMPLMLTAAGTSPSLLSAAAIVLILLLSSAVGQQQQGLTAQDSEISLDAAHSSEELLGSIKESGKSQVNAVTRHYHGDIYILEGHSASCSCSDHGGAAIEGPGELCQCQCPKDRPTFRDDIGTCVNDIKECPLADFLSSSGTEKIPYVFMPYKGQLIHPTAEVALLGQEHEGRPLESPVCVVTKGQVLDNDGWEDMGSTSTMEPPFRLYRDSGKTYIQWVGESETRQEAEGRILLIRLICRDSARPDMPLFSPCLGFRVAGMPGGSTEAALAAPTSKISSGGHMLTRWESAIIGLVSVFIAFILVLGVVLYVRAANRRKRHLEMIRERMMESGYRSAGGPGYGSRHKTTTRHKPSLTSEDDSDNDDIEDLSVSSRNKKNKESVLNFTTTILHEEEEDTDSSWSAENHHHSHIHKHHRVDSERTNQASEKESPVIENTDLEDRECQIANMSYQEADPEDEDEDTVDSASHQCSTPKRKLYFNPAYFEPDLLQEPPPPALEFLSRIREMINVAKNKMRAKNFQPSLIDIPEDDYSLSSRPSTMGRSTMGRSNKVRTIPEETDEELEDSRSRDSFPTDSLERPRDGDSRSSTLKRLANRVNKHGQSLVSEIIKTLDLKPRMPPQDNIYESKIQRSNKPKVPPPKPINARQQQEAEVNDDSFPELIKPSMLKSVIRDGQRLTEVNTTFENFRQEMMATFNKIKKVGDTISPKSTLNKKKKKNEPEKTMDTFDNSNSEEQEGKVNKWLQNNEGKNTYSKMTDESDMNSYFQKAMSDDTNSDLLSTITSNSKNSNSTPYRSESFDSGKNRKLYSSNSKDNYGVSGKTELMGKSGSAVTRSLSWQNEHQHYDSNRRRTRQQVPILPEDTLLTSFGSEYGSLNDLLSEAEAKMPKMIPSDNESMYSDTTRSQYKDSLETKKSYRNNKSPSRKLSCDEEIVDEDSIFDKKKQANPKNKIYSKKSFEKHTTSDYDDEHTYEEILIKDGPSTKPKIRPKLDQINSISNIKIGEEDEDGLYSIYSNPDYISGEASLPENIERTNIIYSQSKLSISLDNNTYSEVEDIHTFDPDTLEKKTTKYDDVNNVLQDSLERPVITKRGSGSKSYRSNNSESIYKLNSPTEMGKGQSLIDIYASKNSLNNFRLHSEDNIDQTEDSITQEHFIRNDPVKRSIKEIRTFKDYQEMRFTRNNNGENNSLPVHGSGINYNFRSSSPTNKISHEAKPPLPPRNVNVAENDLTSPVLPPKSTSVKPPLPVKSIKRMDSPPIDCHKPKLPEKSRKKTELESSDSSFSSGSIPELTDEQARSILHGLLGDSSQNNSRFPTLQDEYKKGKDKITSGSPDSSILVPSYESLTSESSRSSLSRSSNADDSEREGSNTLGRAVETSLDQKIASGSDYIDSESITSDERLCGEFILTSNDRSPTLCRQSSLKRSMQTGSIAKLLDMTDGDIDSESALSKGMEIALALKAKTELENHFKEKSGADSIKRTWRRILENSDDSKENKDRISIMQLQQYMESLDKKEKEKGSKQKQEDSGYQSTDSSDSNGQASSETSATSLNSYSIRGSQSTVLPTVDRRNPDRIVIQPPLQRSLSMQQLGASNYESYSSYDSGSFRRSSLRASYDRRHSLRRNEDNMSVYVNNAFVNDEGS